MFADESGTVDMYEPPALALNAVRLPAQGNSVLAVFKSIGLTTCALYMSSMMNFRFSWP